MTGATPAPASTPTAAAPTADTGPVAPLSGPEYRALDAATKRARLWRAVSSEPYAQLPPVGGQGITAKGTGETLRILWDRATLAQSFDLAEDVRPDREKVFHPHGTVAQVRFEPDPATPYSGIWRSGAAGIARLSLGADDRQYIAGIAVKLFVDGRPSVNLHAIPSLDAQQSRDFFERSPSTALPDPTSWTFRFANLFLQRVANPTRRSVAAMGTTDARGNAIADAQSPASIRFAPRQSLRFAPDTQRDFRAELGDIRSGEVVYDVYGRAADGAPEQRLGAIRLESRFVASRFGDRELSFQHQR
ncbi:MAG TPA: hypothetical protein VLC93_11870 [Myxococcota bacterium]|nr:hypothetical protein [Myxococcota bacterium]